MILLQMTHEEFVHKQKVRAGEVAQGMLDGDIQYLEGALELCSLRHKIEVAEEDEDFIVFVAISSETDHLPIGQVRKYWSKAALERHQAEIQKSIDWAKKISLTQCKSLVKRFGA